MINSRKLTDLREDVRINCETFLSLCKDAGLNVLITQTLRDDEYQAALYAQGRTAPGGIVTNSKVTDFHGKGLAFDICKNVKGHEYDDSTFFSLCGQIAKQIGFSWGGDWKSFPDYPHIQWDDHKRYTSSMVRGGKLPPMMEEYMDQATFNKMMDTYLSQRNTKTVSSWAKQYWDEAKNTGLMDGSAPQGFVTREQLAKIIQTR